MSTYGDKMVDEITSLIEKKVYTDDGVYVGIVEEVVMDSPTCKIDKLLLRDVSQDLIKGAECVSVPYRWVRSVGNIIVLSFFPEKVELKKEEEEETTIE